jgi:ubiquinone/menaquinone biosynthesis C-methylase UbiE
MFPKISLNTKAQGGHPDEGLQTKGWDKTRIDLVSDITEIPASDASVDAVLCSVLLEHVPEPTHALGEFMRLLKPGGILILTAPFASNVHMAPHHFCSGFSKYWYSIMWKRVASRCANWSPTATGMRFSAKKYFDWVEWSAARGVGRDHWPRDRAVEFGQFCSAA